MLALSVDGDSYRGREAAESIEYVGDAGLVTLWRPWPDVTVVTWLVAAPPWHVRVHSVSTAQPLAAAELGFALQADEEGAVPRMVDEADEAACAESRAGISIVVDLTGGRRPSVIDADPNTNVLHPRCVSPAGLSEHDSGTHWLASAVAARPAAANDTAWRARPPRFTSTPGGFVISGANGHPLFTYSKAAASGSVVEPSSSPLEASRVPTSD